MPANTSRIFPLTPNDGAMGVVLSTAMTDTKAFDGTEAVGTAMALVYTAGSNGSKPDKLYVRLGSTAGAAASGTTSATLVRFWVNNGSANTTATNNSILPYEIAIPATAVTALATSALTPYEYPVDLPVLPAGYKLYAGLTVAVGGTNCAVIVQVHGGDY